MDRNNEKPSCERGARNASKLAQKDPPASIGAEEDTHNLNLYAGITLEAILEPSNLKEALKRVVANRGAPGIDGMEVGQLLDWIRNHPGQLTKTIKEGTYRPSPVKRVSIPKDEPGKFRDLRVPGSENSDSHRPSCATSNSPSTRLGLRQGLLTPELRVQTEHACSPCSQNHSGRSRSRLPMGSGHGLSQR